MNSNKDIFHQQRLMAIELSQILTNEKYNELYKSRNIKTVFPNGYSVYTKDLVVQYIKEKKLGIALNLKLNELPLHKSSTNINDNKEEENNSNKNIKVNNDVNELLKHCINLKHTLNYLYKSAPKSRFNFVNGNQNLSGNEISQIIPSQINDFITQQFVRHSIFYNDEQNDISEYYFSLKPTSLDSNDSWSSLVSIVNKYDDYMKKKFNTY